MLIQSSSDKTVNAGKKVAKFIKHLSSHVFQADVYVVATSEPTSHIILPNTEVASSLTWTSSY